MTLPEMTLAGIAHLIALDWKNVNFAARPYLDAMYSLKTVNDSYGCDSGRSIVAYFLCNSQGWKGETAKAIKTELRRRIK